MEKTLGIKTNDCSQNSDNILPTRPHRIQGKSPVGTFVFAASNWEVGIFFFSSIALNANNLRDFSMRECLRGNFCWPAGVAVGSWKRVGFKDGLKTAHQPSKKRKMSILTERAQTNHWYFRSRKKSHCELSEIPQYPSLNWLSTKLRPTF